MIISLGLLGITEYYLGVERIMTIFGVAGYVGTIDLALLLFMIILLLSIRIIASSGSGSKVTPPMIRRPITPRRFSELFPSRTEIDDNTDEQGDN